MDREAPPMPGEVIVHLTPDDLRRGLERDVRDGLSQPSKRIPSAWFYDEVGSGLFDEITRLDEYYQTRTERALLARHAPEIVAISEAATLIELGSGTCEKTRVVLDEMEQAGSLAGIVALDISAEFLERSVVELAAEYPSARVTGLVADFSDGVRMLPDAERRLVAFLGGTIGNLLPDERATFFSAIASSFHADDWFLLGCDLIKDRQRLLDAYDDARGVTAEFNKNVLAVINAQLGADFDLDAFEHVACYDEENDWIEMRLRSTRTQVATISAIDLEVRFAEGEELRTEISAKFTPTSITEELAASGLEVAATWGADEGDFLVTLARRAETNPRERGAS